MKKCDKKHKEKIKKYLLDKKIKRSKSKEQKQEYNTFQTTQDSEKINFNNYIYKIF